MSMTLSTLRKYKETGTRFACLTAYDASFARLSEEAGVEVLLVGDSLGMVVQGQETTVPVTMDEMVYHTRNVRRGSANALVMTDMPFLSAPTPEQALINAGRLMKEGGAHMVKLEGGAPMVETVQRLSDNGIPVCAHLGLLPQTVYKLGGYRMQGRDPAAAEAILHDAVAMERAGADMILLELVPRDLAAAVTRGVGVPVIGIGAGSECDAQVLVIYDLLGITPGKTPRFAKNFLSESGNVQAAVAAYVQAVKDGRFPAAEHTLA